MTPSRKIELPEWAQLFLVLVGASTILIGAIRLLLWAVRGVLPW